MKDGTPADGKIDAAKAGVAWLGVGAASTVDWSQIAAMLASAYTLLLICEWTWKKVLRPFCERRGWVKRKLRRSSDRDAADSDRVGL